MTMIWRSLTVYTSAPEDILRDVIAGCLVPGSPDVSCSFWERHYVSGTQWRVRLGGPTAAGVDRQLDALEAACRSYLADHPSPPEPYDPHRVAYLLERESAPVPDDVTVHRQNECVRAPYPDDMRVSLSEPARELADEYRHFAYRACLPLLGDREAAFVALLRAYWLHALLVTGGDLGEGCVSFKSHWSGFAATFEAEAVVTRIESAFALQSGALAHEAGAVVAWHAAPNQTDSWLSTFDALTRDFMVRARQRLDRGETLTYQAATVEEQQVRQAEAMSRIVRPNGFLSLVWDDPRFLASLHASPAFLWARAMTNLLYILVAASGLSALDRQVLCRFAFGGAEALLGENLDDRMARTQAEMITRAFGAERDA